MKYNYTIVTFNNVTITMKIRTKINVNFLGKEK